MSVVAVREHLGELARSSKLIEASFFKTGPGEYAEHDRFMGLRVPLLRNCLKIFPNLSYNDVESLLTSPINEERLLALFFMIKRYPQDHEGVYHMFCRHMDHINNWNLVDASSHHIVGAYAWKLRDRSILDELAGSVSMWKRRIAIVATWHTIACGEYDWTIHIAERLLKDNHDLIHKAVGWMLRETGKKSLPDLLRFLDRHAKVMPRTMLRYAIEKLSDDQREMYMKG